MWYVQGQQFRENIKVFFQGKSFVFEKLNGKTQNNYNLYYIILVIRIYESLLQFIVYAIILITGFLFV